jgi:biotin operon repressor
LDGAALFQKSKQLWRNLNMKATVPFSRSSMNKSEQSLAAKIWTAIRELRVFTLDAIASQLSLTSQEVQGYIFWLRRVGYIAFTANGFELVQDTGIKAPIATKSGFCDPNVVA